MKGRENSIAWVYLSRLKRNQLGGEGEGGGEAVNNTVRRKENLRYIYELIDRITLQREKSPIQATLKG